MVSLKKSIENVMKKSSTVIGENRKLHFDQEDQDAQTEGRSMRNIDSSYNLSCIKHFSIELLAKKIIDEVFEEAIVRTTDYNLNSSIVFIEGIEVFKRDSSDQLEDDADKSVAYTSAHSIIWPSIVDFDVDVAIAKIDDYISFWVLAEGFKHVVTLLKTESDELCDIYIFDAMFSVPCRAYPIPQATASVYFTMEVSRVCPSDCPVTVYYCLEGSRQRFTPGHFVFQESWLHNIIDAKILFYKSLTF